MILVRMVLNKRIRVASADLENGALSGWDSLEMRCFLMGLESRVNRLSVLIDVD